MPKFPYKILKLYFARQIRLLNHFEPGSPVVQLLPTILACNRNILMKNGGLFPFGVKLMTNEGFYRFRPRKSHIDLLENVEQFFKPSSN